VYLLGGGTAVLQGWRPSTIDADLYADKDETTISKASRSACNSTSS
jgi:hypothetical protein